jgi:hypothetical protein
MVKESTLPTGNDEDLDNEIPKREPAQAIWY